MKLMFASDLHGSLFFCEKLMREYEKEKPDKLIFRVFFDFWLYNFIWHKFVYNKSIDWNKREPLF